MHGGVRTFTSYEELLEMGQVSKEDLAEKVRIPIQLDHCIQRSVLTS